MRRAEPRAHARLCLVALGGNVGDVAATFRWAQSAMQSRMVQVCALSRLYRSLPQQLPHTALQPDYLNAVCLLRVSCSPPALLARLQRLERRAGPRPRQRWAPRRLDLDIVAFERCRLRSRQLTLPHPRAHERAFVLQPACDVAAAWPLGPPHGTVAAALARLPASVPRCCAASLGWFAGALRP